jgi:hypothetical protein
VLPRRCWVGGRDLTLNRRRDLVSGRTNPCGGPPGPHWQCPTQGHAPRGGRLFHRREGAPCPAPNRPRARPAHPGIRASLTGVDGRSLIIAAGCGRGRWCRLTSSMAYHGPGRTFQEDHTNCNPSATQRTYSMRPLVWLFIPGGGARGESPALGGPGGCEGRDHCRPPRPDVFGSRATRDRSERPPTQLEEKKGARTGVFPSRGRRSLLCAAEPWPFARARSRTLAGPGGVRRRGGRAEESPCPVAGRSAGVCRDDPRAGLAPHQGRYHRHRAGGPTEVVPPGRTPERGGKRPGAGAEVTASRAALLSVGYHPPPPPPPFISSFHPPTCARSWMPVAGKCPGPALAGAGKHLEFARGPSQPHNNPKPPPHSNPLSTAVGCPG